VKYEWLLNTHFKCIHVGGWEMLNSIVNSNQINKSINWNRRWALKTSPTVGRGERPVRWSKEIILRELPSTVRCPSWWKYCRYKNRQHLALFVRRFPTNHLMPKNPSDSWDSGWLLTPRRPFGISIYENLLSRCTMMVFRLLQCHLHCSQAHFPATHCQYCQPANCFVSTVNMNNYAHQQIITQLDRWKPCHVPRQMSVDAWLGDWWMGHDITFKIYLSVSLLMVYT